MKTILIEKTDTIENASGEEIIIRAGKCGITNFEPGETKLVTALLKIKSISGDIGVHWFNGPSAMYSNIALLASHSNDESVTFALKNLDQTSKHITPDVILVTGSLYEKIGFKQIAEKVTNGVIDLNVSEIAIPTKGKTRRTSRKKKAQLPA